MEEGEKGRGERDPFEDLDQFFAPIEDDPEELAAAPVEEPPAAELTGEEAAEALEGLEVEIDLPDDLIEGLSEADEDLDVADGAGPAPDETSELDPAEGGEWDRVRAETLAGSSQEIAGGDDDPSAGGPELEGYPGLAGEDLEGVEVESGEMTSVADAGSDPDQPASEAEAAAEHFATGMREADDLERELLSDLDSGSPETVRIEPPEPVAEAPTWQEGAQPVRAEEPPPTGVGRNVPAALVSGILLGAAVLALLAINKGAFVVLATAAVLLAQAELYAVMRSRGLQPATLLGLVCGGFTFVGAYLHGEPAVLLGLALGVGLTVPWYVAAPLSARKHTTANAAATILGLAYVPLMASFAMLLLRIEGGTDGEVGRNLFLAMLVLTVLYDVTAYAIGSIWGHRPLAPTISPNKSWEGALGATFIVLLVALAVVPNFTPFNIEGIGPGPAVGLALIIALVAPLGDLVESAFKRDLGVKDMGSLLPGHGGMLDRIDAVLYTAPAAYFLLRIILS